ncbi:MAG: hypothetical protein PHV05_02985 [Candidatus Riflebacteria bacterium]|nr:hypothetical protein [Candidatus Riflebacteria bacterium]
MNRFVLIFAFLFAAFAASGFAGNLTADTVATGLVSGDVLVSGANTPAVISAVAATQSVGKIDLLFSILPWVISGLTVLLAFMKAKKDGKTWSEALHVAINTLKVEDKMIDGAFKNELVQKVEAVSDALQVSAEAKSKVETILREGREVDDIKIASINGKKIYLGDITGIGSALAAAINRIRKIRLKF